MKRSVIFGILGFLLLVNFNFVESVSVLHDSGSDDRSNWCTYLLDYSYHPERYDSYTGSSGSYCNCVSSIAYCWENRRYVRRTANNCLDNDNLNNFCAPNSAYFYQDLDLDKARRSDSKTGVPQNANHKFVEVGDEKTMIDCDDTNSNQWRDVVYCKDLDGDEYYNPEECFTRCTGGSDNLEAIETNNNAIARVNALGEDCNDDDPDENTECCVELMSLNYESNSHAALADYSDSDYPICTPNNEKIVGGSNNPQLWLSEDYNSHVSTLEDEVYDVPINFGDDLTNCYLFEDSCPDGSSCVITLYDSTNSHAAACDSSEAYSKKFCCGSVVKPYWANMDGEKISKDSSMNAQVGDSVEMVLEGLTPGNSVNFEIREKDSILNDDIRVGEYSINATVESDGVVRGIWTITEEDLVKTSDLDDFYFVTTNSEILEGYKSNYMEVLEDSDDSPAQISFLSPTCGSIFDRNGDVDIVLSISDEDDVISGNLSINEVFDRAISNQGLNFSTSFSDFGTKSISYFIENNRGLRVSSIKNIIIAGTGATGTYSAACIDSPTNLEVLSSSRVDFDASSSRGLDCSSGSCIELIPGGSGGERLRFDWTFSDYIGTSAIHETHSGLGNLTKSYSFQKTFSRKPTTGLNWAELSLEVLE